MQTAASHASVAPAPQGPADIAFSSRGLQFRRGAEKSVTFSDKLVTFWDLLVTFCNKVSNFVVVNFFVGNFFVSNFLQKSEKTTRILIKVLQNHRGGCMVWRRFDENP